MAHNYKYEADNEGLKNEHVPERSLLVGILYQAIHDITFAKLQSTRNACIAWFYYDGEITERSKGFYFKDIIEELDLTSFQVDLILKHIEQIRYDHKCKTEGQTNRTRGGALLDIPGIPKCETDPAIQRGRGPFRLSMRRVRRVASRVQRNQIRTSDKKLA